MSRVHELGRMRLPALVALYLDMAGHEFRGQATRLGYVPGPDRDRVIAAIRTLETSRNTKTRPAPIPEDQRRAA